MSSKNGQQINNTLTSQQQQAAQQQNQVFNMAMQKSPEQQRYETNESAFDNFLNSKDYSHPPAGSMLGFDLWSPSHTAAQSAKMADLQGVGAANLGGNDSIALGLSKQHQADEAAQNAGQSYENAIAGQKAFYDGSDLGYTQATNQKYGSLFGTASNNNNNATGAWVQYKSRPSPWASILGSAIGAAGQIGAAYYGS